MGNKHLGAPEQDSDFDVLRADIAELSQTIDRKSALPSKEEVDVFVAHTSKILGEMIGKSVGDALDPLFRRLERLAHPDPAVSTDAIRTFGGAVTPATFLQVVLCINQNPREAEAFQPLAGLLIAAMSHERKTDALALLKKEYDLQNAQKPGAPR